MSEKETAECAKHAKTGNGRQQFAYSAYFAVEQPTYYLDWFTHAPQTHCL